MKLRELCARKVPDLESCTNQDKRDAYTHLYLRVRATPEGADVEGYVQPELIATAQTSGCLSVRSRLDANIQNWPVAPS